MKKKEINVYNYLLELTKTSLKNQQIVFNYHKTLEIPIKKPI